MAYFSNGTEFDVWQGNNCEKCAHDMLDCPILSIQDLFNYEQHRNVKLRYILESFIPEENDMFPGQCKMFIERTPQ